MNVFGQQMNGLLWTCREDKKKNLTSKKQEQKGQWILYESFRGLRKEWHSRLLSRPRWNEPSRILREEAECLTFLRGMCKTFIDYGVQWIGDALCLFQPTSVRRTILG